MRLSPDEQKLVDYFGSFSMLQKFFAIIYYFTFVPPVAIIATKLTEIFGFTEFLQAGSYGLYFFLASLIALLILLPIIMLMLWFVVTIVSISDVQFVPTPVARRRAYESAINDGFVPVRQPSFSGMTQQSPLVWAFRPSAMRSVNNPSLAAFAVPSMQYASSGFSRKPKTQSINHADLSRLFVGSESLFQMSLDGAG